VLVGGHSASIGKSRGTPELVANRKECFQQGQRNFLAKSDGANQKENKNLGSVNHRWNDQRIISWSHDGIVFCGFTLTDRNPNARSHWQLRLDVATIFIRCCQGGTAHTRICGNWNSGPECHFVFQASGSRDGKLWAPPERGGLFVSTTPAPGN